MASRTIDVTKVMIVTVVMPFLLWEAGITRAAVTSITPTTGAGNLGTTVTQSGNTYNITGGTRPGNGVNVFHSFGNFSVGTSDIANFLNTPVGGVLLPTANILGRVTGANISSIYGTIQTTGFGSANLFLINPAGFLFGPNATINIGGMMTFTTADYLRLADGGRFNANPNATVPDVLTAAPVAAFGFLGTNPAAINFEGGQLTVANGTGLALISGDINLIPDTSGTPSSITAHGRSIQFTSVAGPGEVAADTGIPAAGMTLGTITLGQGTILDTSGDLSFGDGSGGAISIRGGQFVATAANILTSPASGSSGQGGAITITASDTASFTDGSFIITSSSSPNGDAGSINIAASHVTLQDSIIFAEYAGDGTTAGNGGAVTLTGTDSVALTRSFIVTDTFSSNGNGGAVNTTAPIITMEDSGMFTGTFGGGSGGAVTLTGTSSVSLTNSGIDTSTSSTTGNSGLVTISAPNIMMTGIGPAGTTIDTSTHSFDFPTAGNGGDIVIAGTSITITDSAQIRSVADSSGSFSKGGTIRITGSDSILVGNGTLLLTTSTSQGGAGDIQLASKHVTITGQSTLSSETLGPGSGGTIKISGRENIALESGSLISTNSANSGGAIQGPAGHIEFDTQQLTISGGSTVRSQTFGTGLGGTITAQGINGPAQSILITGSGSGFFSDTNSFIQDGNIVGTGTGGNIIVNAHSVTVQNSGTLSANTSGAGNAGNLFVKADSVTITGGGQLTSSSKIRRTPLFEGEEIPLPSGNAGTVTIEGLASPAQTVTISGTGSGIFTSTEGIGAGGNIFVNASSVTLQNGAHVSSSSTGTGVAGDVTINAGNQFAMTNSSITTEANQSSGGAIKITTNSDGAVQLTNSTISASVLDGIGGGGSVNIDPQYVVLQNSQIIANAVFGPGGNINITTNLLLPDTSSIISASSQFGQQGNIVIQSPVSPASGKINPLGQKPLLATSMISQRCAALTGGNFSSFTVAGRDSLPAEPGGWLSTPLALSVPEPENGAVKEADSKMWDEAPLLSLRKIVPSGFLTQAFPVESSGCSS